MWHRARNAKAVAARVRAKYREARRKAERFKTPSGAWAAGYQAGYNRAMRWWKRQVERGRVDAAGRLMKRGAAA